MKITKPITYEQARKISIWVWEQRAKGKHITHTHIEKQYGIAVMSNCGFCEYYLNSPFQGCQACPLYWKDAKAENNSRFNIHTRNCTRAYWKWDYHKPANRWKIYWAKKLLAEIKATPKHEVQPPSNTVQ